MLKISLTGRVVVETDEAVIDEREFPGRQGRLLFAYLTCEDGRAVPRGELAEVLWGEEPPATWEKALSVLVSKLRVVLGGNGIDGASALTGGFGCYRLELPEGSWVDALAAASATAEAEQALAAGETEIAKATASAAESLVRQPFLPGDDGVWIEAKRRGLDEVRARAVSVLADASLRTGNGREAAQWAQQAITLEPFRESGYRFLMQAHIATGDRAEALRAYDRCRRLLADELGTYPSPETESIYRALLEPPFHLAQTARSQAPPAQTADREGAAVGLELGMSGLDPSSHQRLEAAILARDPSLELEANRATHLPGPTGSSEVPATGSMVRRRRLRLAFGGVALVALAAVAAVIVATWPRAGPTVIAADSVGAISPSSGALAAVVPVGSSPTGVAAGADAVWVADYNAGTVSRIDLATRAVAAPIPVGLTPGAVAVGAGAVWVANTWGGKVLRIAPGVNRVVQTIGVGNGPSGVSVGFGSVWVTNSSDGTLSRINDVTGTVDTTIPLGGTATDVAAGLGAVWVSDEASGQVLRVDPQSDRITAQINVGNGPTAITVGYGSVWVTNSLDANVSRIDPQTNQVAATIPVGNGPSAIAAGAGGVWVANEFGGSVSRIDAATGRVVRTIGVGSRPQGVAAAGGLVWVGAQASDTRHRGGTLTVLSNSPYGSFDPALAWPPNILLTNDGLTAFARVGGSEGTQVVPDLAVSLPTPTDGGLTYTFQLRRGIRYSDGQPVRPEDFRRAIERDFKLGDANAPTYYADLVGGEACVAHPARCDLSRGIVTDDAAGTVQFHLVAPDPELLDQLALADAVAVPAGTPDHDVGQDPIPATGAYEVASVTPREVRLVRNPYFHVWSRAARPDGYPDQIVTKIGESPSAELTAVERGTADYTNDAPADRLTELETRFATQLYVNPSAVLDTLWLNTRAAPFNDLRVRQALSYAVDRRRIANLVGSGAQPTCQFLTPYIPGYRRYCPYTLDPSRSGAWTAPDLATAERLIEASHTRGMAITLWDLGITGTGDPTGVGRYIVSLLRRLGYKAVLRNSTTNPAAIGQFSDSHTKAQIALGNWLPSYPAASEYIRWFSCQNFVPNSANNPNVAEFCDSQLDGQINRALAAEEARSPAAPDIWAQADKTITNQAPMVPLVIDGITDVVSRRVGNYQFDPMWGVLLDQLWVK